MPKGKGKGKDKGKGKGKEKGKGKKDGKKKTDDPEYVSNHAQALFARDLARAQSKIERRKAWIEKWKDEIQKMKADMVTMKVEEDANIKELKENLEIITVDRQEKIECLKKLEKTLEDNLVNYKKAIIDLEVKRETEGNANKAEIEQLEQQVKDLKLYLKNREKYNEELYLQERRILIKEEHHEDLLEEMREQRLKRGEIIKWEVEEQIHRLIEQVRRFAKGHGPSFERNAEMRELMKLMELEIAELQYLIPEAKKRIGKAKELEALLHEYLREKLDKTRKEIEHIVEDTISMPPPSTVVVAPTVKQRTTEVVTVEKVPSTSEESSPKEQNDNWLFEKVKVVFRAVRRLIVEALSLQLIGEGVLPEEAKAPDADKRYKARRQFIYNRREEALHYALGIIVHGREEIETTSGRSISGSYKPISVKTEVFSSTSSAQGIPGMPGSEFQYRSETSSTSTESLARSPGSYVEGESGSRSGYSAQDLFAVTKKPATLWEFEGEDA